MFIVLRLSAQQPFLIKPVNSAKMKGGEQEKDRKKETNLTGWENQDRQVWRPIDMKYLFTAKIIENAKYGNYMLFNDCF